ncbi:MAG: hypothetical protein DME03_02560 [Candidatus Rokuibacteriota bacterium]|nr:MAG: hypothetical protein DME03_02560 [Candidatus Rokubacteria bacterium]
MPWRILAALVVACLLAVGGWVFAQDKPAAPAAPAASAPAPAAAPAPPPKPDPAGTATGGIADVTAKEAGKPTLTEVADFAGHNRVSINLMWTLLTGFLVMFMQAGFALVETGFTRAKNVAHTMMMNFMRDAIGQDDRLIDVVRDHEHRAPTGRPHPDELVLDDPPREGVDLGEGLVEEQHLRLRRERAREPHPLPHTARQRRRAFSLRAGEPDHVDIALNKAVDVRPMPVRMRRSNGEPDVVEHGHPRHERKVLEHHHAVHPGSSDLSTFEDHTAAGGALEPRDDVE